MLHPNPVDCCLVLHTRDGAASGAASLPALRLPPGQHGTAGAGEAQQPPAQPGADPGGNGDGHPANAAAAASTEDTSADSRPAAVTADQPADLRAEEDTQQQLEEQAGGTCKQS